MANLKEIKLKIKSVQNTEKTTKAMKLVSNVKLKRAKEAATQSSAYAIKINEVLSEISYKVMQYGFFGKNGKFFDTTSPVKMVDIVFVTADKGLCGGFNVKTLKAVRELIEEYKSKNIKVRLRGIGKNGIEYFAFQGIELLDKFIGVSSSPTYEKAQNIIKPVIEDFLNGVTDKIVLIHNGYKNMISQEIRSNELVPVIPPKIIEDKSESLMELEPDDGTILENLMSKYFEYSMYYALVDSLAAEHSARMQAMDSATNNAKERVRVLNLAYNKARQSSITTELVEIISGVEAMK